MKAGYEFGKYFVLVEKNENGKGLGDMGYWANTKSFHKPTGAVMLFKPRRTFLSERNRIAYSNLMQPLPKQEEAENDKLEWI